MRKVLVRWHPRPLPEVKPFGAPTCFGGWYHYHCDGSSWRRLPAGGVLLAEDYRDRFGVPWAKPRNLFQSISETRETD